MSQEVQIPYEDCGHHGVARLGQTIISGRLRWYRSISCPNCAAIEEDGLDVPPDWFRELLLKNGGQWEVHTPGADRVTLLKAIRGLFDLSMEEAVAKGRQFPLVFQGTKTEAQWLSEKLSAANVSSIVKRSEEF